MTDDASDDWSPERQDAVAEAGDGVATGGLILSVDTILQAKVGPIVALHENRFWQLWMNLDDPYLEGRYYLLMEPNDSVWWMATTVGYQIGRNPSDWFLILAARHDMMRTRVHEFQRHLVGGAALWKIPTAWWAWGDPSVATLLEVYVDDRFRRGELFWVFQLTIQL